MIIKTLRWKVGGFDRLVNYVGKEQGEENTFQVTHNLKPSESLSDIARQFEENDQYRRRRKNGVVLYHEILSFHEEDRAQLDNQKLEDMARKYLDLRAPKGLGFAMPHYDKGHVHIHVVLSGVEFRSGKTLRMDNRTFTKLRRSMEAYQVEKYPEVNKSVVHIPKRIRNKELKAEMEREREMIDQCFNEAVGLEDFYDRVSEIGIDQTKYPYDASAGRYDLEVNEEQLRRMDKRMEQLEQSKHVNNERERDGMDY